MDGKINDMESQITRELTQDWKETEMRIMESQHKRNRNIIKEIVNQSKEFRNDLGNEFRKLKGDDY